jgi:hypothetical protein
MCSLVGTGWNRRTSYMARGAHTKAGDRRTHFQWHSITWHVGLNGPTTPGSQRRVAGTIPFLSWRWPDCRRWRLVGRLFRLLGLAARAVLAVRPAGRQARDRQAADDSSIELRTSQPARATTTASSTSSLPRKPIATTATTLDGPARQRHDRRHGRRPPNNGVCTLANGRAQAYWTASTPDGAATSATRRHRSALPDTTAVS